MNLKELSQLDVKDLKNIDYKALLEEAKKSPDILINIAVIILVVAFSLFYFNSKKQELQSLTQNTSVLETKWKIFEELQQAQDALKKLRSVIPAEITEANLIDLIARQAEKNSVLIESFSPATKNNQKLYQTVTMSINIAAPSYADIISFIKAIEYENKTVRIDTLRITPGSSRLVRSGVSISETISVTLTLTVVNFKNG